VLLHGSIVAGVLANAVYWHLTTVEGAYVVSFVGGVAYLTGLLIQLDVAARLVPVEVAATLFAVIMALTNLASSLSEALGGYLYDYLHAGQSAYEWIVLLSTLVIAVCWVWMPRLKREVPAWWM
jgi:hypothetical protein